MKIRINVEWPLSLVLAIDERFIELAPLSVDQLAGLEVALRTLTPREQSVLQSYFKENKTYADIGKHWCISANRVMEITRKALRKLRHPTRIRLIQNGYDAYRVLYEGTEAAVREHYLLRLEAGDISIEECWFPSKTYCTLSVANLRNLRDVVYLTPADFERLPFVTKQTAQTMRRHVVQNLIEMKLDPADYPIGGGDND